MRVPKLSDRASGLLLHPTSLPGPHGSGDLGPSAHRFVRFLADAGQRWWQMLPVGPVGYGDSPYASLSAFAGSALLISPERLVAEGLLRADELAAGEALPVTRVDYAATTRHREALLRRAFQRFTALSPAERSPFGAFCERERAWLEDWALYRALKREHGERPWSAWDPPLRDRVPAALERARTRLARELALASFEQYLFDLQWRALREATAARGIALLGDVPIFVAHDSADVWQHRELFHLDAAGRPSLVAGVPPDYFSATGQRWGNPLYRWRRLRATGYAWWIARFESALARFDAVRLDHFIGFQRCWAVPAEAPTAEHGRWLRGPGDPFFHAVRSRLGALPFVAEDLGAVTPAVTALRRRLGLPGIRVLQFAFGTDPQAPRFRPHHHVRRCVVYTGTHDNDTTAGWFHDPGGAGTPRTVAQAARERAAVQRYLATDGRAIHWDLIRAAMMSVAALAVVPLQDALGLGSAARMNRPGTATGNWTWRCAEEDLTPGLAARLRGLVETYERGPTEPP